MSCNSASASPELRVSQVIAWCRLCRARHNRHYAASRIMPTRRPWLTWMSANPAFVDCSTRHNYRPSRKANNLSSGRYRRTLTFSGGGSGECIFFQLQVRMKIHLGSLHGLVSQPKRDD